MQRPLWGRAAGHRLGVSGGSRSRLGSWWEVGVLEDGEGSGSRPGSD